MDDAYEDRVTITAGGIAYEYKPVMGTEKNYTRKWSYKTNSQLFHKLFDDLKKMTPAILNPTVKDIYTDIGAIEFIVTYADKKRKFESYWCHGDAFKGYFAVVRSMVPGCERIPDVLLNSDDFEAY